MDIAERYFGLQWVVIPTLAWFCASAVAGARIRGHLEDLKTGLKQSRRSALAWFNDNKILGASLATAYLSMVGMFVDASFFARLGLPALRYSDPRDLAFAILSHPIVVVLVAVAALIVLTCFRLLRVGLDRLYGFRFEDHVEGVAGAGLRFLDLPGRAMAMVRILIGLAAAVVMLLLPLVVAVWSAGSAYDRIEDEQSGRLRLAHSGMYADGVKHIASTAKYMVFTFQMCVEEDGGGETTDEATADSAKNAESIAKGRDGGAAWDTLTAFVNGTTKTGR